jgi:hypothetical protein
MGNGRSNEKEAATAAASDDRSHGHLIEAPGEFLKSAAGLGLSSGRALCVVVDEEALAATRVVDELRSDPPVRP